MIVTSDKQQNDNSKLHKFCQTWVKQTEWCKTTLHKQLWNTVHRFVTIHWCLPITPNPQSSFTHEGIFHKLKVTICVGKIPLLYNPKTLCYICLHLSEMIILGILWVRTKNFRVTDVGKQLFEEWYIKFNWTLFMWAIFLGQEELSNTLGKMACGNDG